MNEGMVRTVSKDVLGPEQAGLPSELVPVVSFSTSKDARSPTQSARPEIGPQMSAIRHK